MNNHFLTDEQIDALIARIPAYAPIFGRPTPTEPPRPKDRSRVCLHLGEMRKPRSAACWKLCDHDCNKGHAVAKPGLDCQTCPDYADEDDPDPVGPIRRRHVLHHVMPVSFNGTWQRNADQLIARMPLFNGRRVIAIVTKSAATSQELDPPEAVREYFGRHTCDFLEIPNDPHLREVATWGPMWDLIRPFQDTTDAVLYTHAKGVTRPFDPGVSCHPWATILWASMCDHWPLIEERLREFPIAGSLKKVGYGFQGSESRWHYSGSFFWARVSEVFKHKRVENIDRQWWGNESWPGRHFPPEHAGEVFHSGEVPTLNMYSREYVADLYPEFLKWSAKTPRSVIG